MQTLILAPFSGHDDYNRIPALLSVASTSPSAPVRALRQSESPYLTPLSPTQCSLIPPEMQRGWQSILWIPLGWPVPSRGDHQCQR